jgi:hypothetical protein
MLNGDRIRTERSRELWSGLNIHSAVISLHWANLITNFFIGLEKLQNFILKSNFSVSSSHFKTGQNISTVLED